MVCINSKRMTKIFRPIFNLKTLEVYKCQNDIDACLENLKVCVLS